MAVVLVIALATLLRVPLLSWPFAAHPDAPCCGHPDEIAQYDLVNSFRSGSDPGVYPPGLAFLTFISLKTPVGTAASSLVPAAVTTEERRDRTRVIAMARILSLAVSAAAVFFLYLVCLESEISPWLAAASAPLLALAPLYSVQTTYALADGLNVALLVASLFAFLNWSRRPRLHLEILFGLLLGGVFAVKLVGVVVGLPPLVSMIVRSPSRRRTLLALTFSLLVGAYAFAGGHMRFASRTAMFQKVVVENGRATRVRPGWNAVHQFLSLVPGMGALFLLLLLSSIGWWLIVRARTSRSRVSRLLDPLPAIGAGSILYFLGICLSSNPFTRHMLPLYPVLILFVLGNIDSLLQTRTPARLRTSLPPLLFFGAIAYNTFATGPLLRSFVHDPLDQASAWVRAETRYEPRLAALRNFPPVPSISAGQAVSDGSTRLIIVHSAWLGRFTGSWWLKPAPSDARDVYHFDGSLEDVRSWQKLFAGQPTEWRILASFGDDWKTPERVFLSFLGRGYDQFVTAGRVYVVARGTGLRNEPRAVGGL